MGGCFDIPGRAVQRTRKRKLKPIMTTHKLRTPSPRPGIHPSDKGLPRFLRRCLDPKHKGLRILPLCKFHKNATTNKGRRHICRICRNRNKQKDPTKKYYREKTNSVFGSSTTNGFYKIVEDPHKLFTNGVFRKYDFCVTFAGRYIWAPNMIVEDNDGFQYTLQYEPKPGLLRDDGLFFHYDKEPNRFVREH